MQVDAITVLYGHIHTENVKIKRNYCVTPHIGSLVPRPPLAAFLQLWKNVRFSTAAKKSCEGRPGCEANT